MKDRKFHFDISMLMLLSALYHHCKTIEAIIVESCNAKNRKLIEQASISLKYGNTCVKRFEDEWKDFLNEDGNKRVIASIKKHFDYYNATLNDSLTYANFTADAAVVRNSIANMAFAIGAKITLLHKKC